MKVAMIGCGKLGYPCAMKMKEAGHDVIGVDPWAPWADTEFPIYHSITDRLRDRDIIFIAVPTPHDKAYGGEKPTTHLPPKDFDYSIAEDVLTQLCGVCTEKQLVVLISTVLPSTNRKILRCDDLPFRYIYNPYLIAMGSVEWDMVNPEMVIIGTSDGDETTDAKVLVDFYKTMMQNNPRYVIGTWEEAESIKIFYNTWISTKIALSNMIQDVAMKVGNMNVDVVTKALADSTMRITGPAYMKAGMGDAGACLHPETLIYTDRGLLEIKDVVVGDSVIGEDGKFHLVEKVWINKHSKSGENYSGDLLKVKSTSQTPILLTPDHNVYVSGDTRKRYITGGKKRYLNSKTIKISQQVTDVHKVHANALTVDDHYLISPIIKESFTIPEYATQEYIELAGYYISEGSCEKGRKGDYDRITFSLHRKERDTIAARIEYLIKILYPNTANKISIRFKGERGLSVRHQNKELASRLVQDFGHGCQNKVLPNWVLFNKNPTILRGIFQGDGTKNKSGFALSTTSKKLAIGVASLLKQNGIFASVQSHPPRVGKKDGVYHREAYEVRVRNSIFMNQMEEITGMENLHKMQSKKYNETLFSIDDSTYHRVRAVEPISYNGPVYDLQVADVHNYLTEGGLVSNCHPRDGIALSYLANKLNLGYDMFKSLNETREQQAKNVAKFLVRESRRFEIPRSIYIHGRAYKPHVRYTDGSYSELIGHYVEELTGRPPIYVDPLTNDHVDVIDGVVLMAHHAPTTYSHARVIGSSSQKFYAPIAAGSIVVDIWRYLTPDDVTDCTLIHYGNTR